MNFASDAFLVQSSRVPVCPAGQHESVVLQLDLPDWQLGHPAMKVREILKAVVSLKQMSEDCVV